MSADRAPGSPGHPLGTPYPWHRQGRGLRSVLSAPQTVSKKFGTNCVLSRVNTTTGGRDTARRQSIVKDLEESVAQAPPCSGLHGAIDVLDDFADFWRRQPCAS